MSYLLAKYTLLFLVATILGFALGYWWSRRNFVDVSESFESLRRASDKSDWKQLWGRLDAIPTPKEPDFSAVNSRLDEMNTAISSVDIPTPKEPDFSEVNGRLDKLNTAIANVDIPTPKDPDFSEINRRLDKLSMAIASVDIPMPKEPDFTEVNKRLDKMNSAIASVPVVETHEAANLAPINTRLADLDTSIRSIPVTGPVNLSPVEGRLDSIEIELRRLGQRLEERPAPEPAPAPRKASDEPVILSAALYGDKDDLKQISGVGPKLERLLNTNGVYYFWQVASWNKSDIDFIDDRLDVFRGRIFRDDWVHQAKNLKEDPAAAKMPAQ